MRKLAARQATPAVRLPKKSFRQRVVIDFRKNWVIYAIALLCLSYYFVFRYAPMGGLAIAFKNYRPARGLWGSNWVGFKWFEQFFSSYYFPRLLRNTAPGMRPRKLLMPCSFPALSLWKQKRITFIARRKRFSPWDIPDMIS